LHIVTRTPHEQTATSTGWIRGCQNAGIPFDARIGTVVTSGSAGAEGIPTHLDETPMTGD